MAKAQNNTALVAQETNKVDEGGAIHMGRRFDETFAEYLEICDRSNDTMNGFFTAIDAFKVPKGSPQFGRLLNARCGDIVEEQHAMAAQMDAITKIIREMPITGPISLLVKAKALQFDCGLYPMKGPLEDWDWCEECLHIFITQVSGFAAGRPL
jgi:hypothetical protein